MMLFNVIATLALEAYPREIVKLINLVTWHLLHLCNIHWKSYFSNVLIGNGGRQRSSARSVGGKNTCMFSACSGRYLHSRPTGSLFCKFYLHEILKILLYCIIHCKIIINLFMCVIWVNFKCFRLNQIYRQSRKYICCMIVAYSYKNLYSQFHAGKRLQLIHCI